MTSFFDLNTYKNPAPKVCDFRGFIFLFTSRILCAIINLGNKKYDEEDCYEKIYLWDDYSDFSFFSC